MTEVAVRVALHRALKSLADGLEERELMKTADLIAALAADANAPGRPDRAPPRSCARRRRARQRSRCS